MDSHPKPNLVIRLIRGSSNIDSLMKKKSSKTLQFKNDAINIEKKSRRGSANHIQSLNEKIEMDFLHRKSKRSIFGGGSKRSVENENTLGPSRRPSKLVQNARRFSVLPKGIEVQRISQIDLG